MAEYAAARLNKPSKHLAVVKGRPEQPTAGDRQRLQQAQNGALAVIPMFFDSSQAGRIKNTEKHAALLRYCSRRGEAKSTYARHGAAARRR